MIAESNFLHEYVLAGVMSVASFYRLYTNHAYPPCPPSGAILLYAKKQFLFLRTEDIYTKLIHVSN